MSFVSSYTATQRFMMQRAERPAPEQRELQEQDSQEGGE
jgi:hypothetical protein